MAPKEFKPSTLFRNLKRREAGKNDADGTSAIPAEGDDADGTSAVPG
jgi:hypothetical protein